VPVAISVPVVIAAVVPIRFAVPVAISVPVVIAAVVPIRFAVPVAIPVPVVIAAIVGKVAVQFGAAVVGHVPFAIPDAALVGIDASSLLEPMDAVR
jgi:hypothetical protein